MYEICQCTKEKCQDVLWKSSEIKFEWLTVNSVYVNEIVLFFSYSSLPNNEYNTPT